MSNSPLATRRLATRACVAMASLVIFATAYALKGTTPDQLVVPLVPRPVANSLLVDEAEPEIIEPDHENDAEALDPIIGWQSVSQELNESDDAPDYADVTEGYVIIDHKSGARRPHVHRIHSRKARARLGERLRKEYPAVSLEQRLAKFRRMPALPPKCVELDTYQEWPPEPGDYRSQHAYLTTSRSRALQKLHSDNVSDFIEAKGFGHSRMSYMPEELIVRDEIEVFPAEPLINDRPEYGFQTLELRDRTISYFEWMVNGHGRHEGSAMPTFNDLLFMHGENQDRFASVPSFGYVKDTHNVAGFMPHAFRGLEGIGPYTKDGKTVRYMWQISRLELVSLLMYDEPAVYVSKSLPRMSELAEYPVTRGLDDFEQTALAKLEAGENVVYRAMLNQIEMVGAIRAVNQCLQCHQVPRGSLLGAFSYSLFRDPPVDVPENVARQ